MHKWMNEIDPKLYLVFFKLVSTSYYSKVEISVRKSLWTDLIRANPDMLDIEYLLCLLPWSLIMVLWVGSLVFCGFSVAVSWNIFLLAEFWADVSYTPILFCALQFPFIFFHFYLLALHTGLFTKLYLSTCKFLHKLFPTVSNILLKLSIYLF